MKYVRFQKDNQIFYGIVENDKVMKLEGDLFGKYAKTDVQYDLEQVTLLAPCSPSKVVAVGLNYRDHAKEMGEALPDVPKIFLKASTCVIGPEEKIVIPQMSKRVDYEAEIAAVIKKTAKNITADQAGEYILGYTCLNDVTARDLQKSDGQWTRGKSFDTFAPIGPYISDEIDANGVDIKLLLNGEQKQHSNTSNFIWKIEELVSFISQVMTLLPGDVITTGTPSGIGPMKQGDCVEVVIEGLGTLRNYVE
ncbi:fumarylacetoacetate hydrolase family protein [Petroclostridium sp. X23]|uniref:fumarylacetoacetate hydrolase family protein n=1 Tax=Petroclostridium sp. X23 TaxID=3045146 RepID=UPI0024ACDE8F|nr:fumarylacetoacetate hydrolase family protein [Petroclostridium sp. X23]WHH60249.1 fumarylacetoacetate hydrolase family protein [Petroclostridium sp. X23]